MAGWGLLLPSVLALWGIVTGESSSPRVSEGIAPIISRPICAFPPVSIRGFIVFKPLDLLIPRGVEVVGEVAGIIVVVHVCIVGCSGDLCKQNPGIHTVEAAEFLEVHPLTITMLLGDLLGKGLANRGTPGASVVGERASEDVELGVLHGVHCSVWCACGQASTVRNAGEEDEDHGDAHGKEGDDEHVGGAAVVVHAPIIT